MYTLTDYDRKMLSWMQEPLIRPPRPHGMSSIAYARLCQHLQHEVSFYRSWARGIRPWHASAPKWRKEYEKWCEQYHPGMLEQYRRFEAMGQQMIAQLDTIKTDARTQLGVTASASQDDIKRAYRRKAKDMHPDTGGSHESMVALTRAYKTLTRV